MRPVNRRDQQCEKLAIRRTVRMRMRQAVRGAIRVLLIALLPALAGIGGWGWWHGWHETGMDLAKETVYTATAEYGWVLRKVRLSGRAEAPRDEVMDALALKPGTSLLAYDVDAMREKLEAVGWVKKARVERRFPDTLVITIEERSPIALWQHDGRLWLVDSEGVTFDDPDMSRFYHLPVLAGKGATGETQRVLAMLTSEPELYRAMASARRVGGRRWNVRFVNGVEVALPEANPEAAWHLLAEMQAREAVLARDIDRIDLRLPGRAYITLRDAALETIKAASKPGNPT